MIQLIVTIIIRNLNSNEEAHPTPHTPDMASPLPPLKKATRLLLFAAFIWAISCWTWTITHLQSAVSSSLLSPSSSLQQQDAPSSLSNERTRHLSNSVNNSSSRMVRPSSKAQDSHHSIHLRRRETTASSASASQLNQPPPITSLIYPLHAKSGTHHAYLYIGSPVPQRQTLIVDTGSRLTAFPCQPHCSNCGEHASSPFQLSESTSSEIVPCGECSLSRGDFELEGYFSGNGIGGNSLRGATGNEADIQLHRKLLPQSCNSNNQCEVNQKYTEGSSWTAFEVKDKVWLGLDGESASVEQHDKHSTLFVFGCQVSEEGLFRTQYADGIIGLSMYTQTLVGTWKRQGSIAHESFSLCFNRRGGHISLGGVTSSEELEQTKGEVAGPQHLKPMQFTPFARDKVWYYTVTITSVSVGSHVLPHSLLRYLNDNKGAIVDSGTTDTFLSHKIAKAFSLAWEKVTGQHYHNRMQQFTFDQFNNLPVITYELEGGLQWQVKPEAYMEMSDLNESESIIDDLSEPWEGNRGLTSRIYVDEPSGAVLGANAMLNHDVYFDIENRRLGVARATCAY